MRSVNNATPIDLPRPCHDKLISCVQGYDTDSIHRAKWFRNKRQPEWRSLWGRILEWCSPRPREGKRSRFFLHEPIRPLCFLVHGHGCIDESLPSRLKATPCFGDNHNINQASDRKSGVVFGRVLVWGRVASRSTRRQGDIQIQRRAGLFRGVEGKCSAWTRQTVLEHWCECVHRISDWCFRVCARVCGCQYIGIMKLPLESTVLHHGHACIHMRA